LCFDLLTNKAHDAYFSASRVRVNMRQHVRVMATIMMVTAQHTPALLLSSLVLWLSECVATSVVPRWLTLHGASDGFDCHINAITVQLPATARTETAPLCCTAAPMFHPAKPFQIQTHLDKGSKLRVSLSVAESVCVAAGTHRRLDLCLQ
jgi:hypothetical protein